MLSQLAGAWSASKALQQPVGLDERAQQCDLDSPASRRSKRAARLALSARTSRRPISGWRSAASRSAFKSPSSLAAKEFNSSLYSPERNFYLGNSFVGLGRQNTGDYAPNTKLVAVGVQINAPRQHLGQRRQQLGRRKRTAQSPYAKCLHFEFSSCQKMGVVLPIAILR